jgi:hypothetical protein
MGARPFCICRAEQVLPPGFEIDAALFRLCLKHRLSSREACGKMPDTSAVATHARRKAGFVSPTSFSSSALRAISEAGFGVQMTSGSVFARVTAVS